MTVRELRCSSMGCIAPLLEPCPLCGSLDVPGSFGGFSLTEPTGTSCCLNAFVSLLADSCTALQPQAGFSYLPGTDPQQILFSSMALQADSVFWDFGEGRTSTEPNPVHRFFVPGPYEVCQITYNGCGVDSLCESIFVNCEVEADFDFLLDSSNLTVSFLNQSTNATSWIWDFGDGNLDTLATPVHQYPGPDPFLVSLIALGPCGADTAARQVLPLCQPTTADFSFASDSTNLTSAFSNLSTNGETYMWDFGEGTDEQSICAHTPISLCRYFSGSPDRNRSLYIRYHLSGSD